MIDEKEPELPNGWIKEFDNNYQAYFYVDTNANPPRSIWVHPYKDEQYLREHPEVREKVGSASGPPSYPGYASPAGPPPIEGRISSSKMGSSSQNQEVTSINSEKQKRGFFGKLKDKAIGTKEERELAKLEQERMADERRQKLALEKQQRQQRQQEYYNQQRLQGGAGGQYVPATGAQQAYYGGAPQAGYAPGYQTQYYPAQQQQGRSRLGGGGMALPLLGGLAGGLLLGEALDGFDGGDFGGGDFGGGDFGGDF